MKETLSSNLIHLTSDTTTTTTKSPRFSDKLKQCKKIEINSKRVLKIRFTFHISQHIFRNIKAVPYNSQYIKENINSIIIANIFIFYFLRILGIL